MDKEQAVVEIEKHATALREASIAVQEGDLQSAYYKVGAAQRALATLQTEISALHARGAGADYADQTEHSSTEPPVVVARQLANEMAALALDMAETEEEIEEVLRYEEEHSFVDLGGED